jgi:CheY-like chemotaxis protein
MPVMDGLEATKRILHKRKHHQMQNAPPKIVFLTAHALKEYQEKAASVGVDGFISKPFKIEIIKNICTDLCLGREDVSLQQQDAVTTTTDGKKE